MRGALMGVVLIGVVLSGVGLEVTTASPATAEVHKLELELVDQISVDEAPKSQEATSDGTLPYRLLAIGMAALASMLGVLTFWYWKATMPPARRGYLPPGDGEDRASGIQRVLEIDLAEGRVDVAPSGAVDEPPSDSGDHSGL
jgi:hypothetical protein